MNQPKKNDTATTITETIIKALEAGTIPWRKTWTALPPESVSTGKLYRGANVFLLGLALNQEKSHYADPRWITFKQAQDLGGHVRKGERASAAYFWKMLEVADETAEEPKLKNIPYAKIYAVFNVEQCEGLNLKPVLRTSVNPIESADALLATMSEKPTIRHRQTMAFYSPVEDAINMPRQEIFDCDQEYYATLFHELIHWTAKRVNRDVAGNKFGDEKYSFEELVAELGSAILCARTGIDNSSLTQNSAAYIQSWIRVFKNDTKILLKAATAAQKAVDFITGEYQAKAAAEDVA